MIFLDFAQDYQLLFQDPASPMMNGIIDLHHYIMFFLFVILVFVIIMLLSTVELFYFRQKIKVLDHYLLHHIPLEIGTLLGPTVPATRFFVLNRISNQYSDENIDAVTLRRKVSLITQNNNFWTNLNAVSTENNNMVSADFVIADNKKISLVTQVSNGVSFIKGVNFLTTEGKSVISSTFSQYIVNVFLRRRRYANALPYPVVVKAAKRLKERTLISLAIVNIFHAYSLNLYYWFQTYFTIKSGVQNFTHSTVIEVVWTVIPSLVLVCIGVPSFILLYAMDEIIEPDFVVKCIGHQWYWSYEIEYPDFTHELDMTYDISYTAVEDFDDKKNFFANYADNVYALRSFGKSILNGEQSQIFPETMTWGYLNFNSYMTPEDELEFGTPRLLEVDNALILPAKTHIDLLVTANDVIHCWTVPSFGIKMDAVPGRINHANVFIERRGVFYGQCSEICGVNHGFMPIKVIAMDLKEYVDNFNPVKMTPEQLAYSIQLREEMDALMLAELQEEGKI